MQCINNNDKLLFNYYN